MQTVCLPQTAQDERIKRVLRELRIDPTRSIAELAGRVSLSSSRLHHLFRKQTGLTLTQYAKEYRLRRAAALLITTARPLKQIGNECGFSDASALVRCFKQWSGTTPGAYRREHLRMWTKRS